MRRAGLVTDWFFSGVTFCLVLFVVSVLGVEGYRRAMLIPAAIAIAWFVNFIGAILVFDRTYISVAQKRKLLPWWIGWTGILFLGGGFLLDRPGIGAMLIIVPVLAWSNIRMTRFCRVCGHLNRPLPPWCQRCGAALPDQ